MDRTKGAEGMADNSALTQQEQEQVLEEYRLNKAKDAEREAIVREVGARALAEARKRRPKDDQIRMAAKAKAQEAQTFRARADLLLPRAGVTRSDIAEYLVTQLRDSLRGLEADAIRCAEEAAAPDAYATNDDEKESIARRAVESETGVAEMRRVVAELEALLDDDPAPGGDAESTE